MFKRKWHWALVIFIILGIGSFVIFRPKAQVGTVKVYKTHEAVKPTVKPIQTDAVEEVSSADTETQPLSAGTEDTASSVPDTIETHPMDETAISEVSPKISEISEGATGTAGEAEELRYGDYTKEELAQIKEWGEDLRERLLTEYADLRELSDMTPEQIAEKYPTDEDRQRLAERGKKFFEKFLEEASAFLVSLPEPIRKEAFDQIHSNFAQNYGREGADQLMNQVVKMIEEASQ